MKINILPLSLYMIMLITIVYLTGISPEPLLLCVSFLIISYLKR